jgi:hypothetical protein
MKHRTLNEQTDFVLEESEGSALLIQKSTVATSQDIFLRCAFLLCLLFYFNTLAVTGFVGYYLHCAI